VHGLFRVAMIQIYQTQRIKQLRPVRKLTGKTSDITYTTTYTGNLLCL